MKRSWNAFVWLGFGITLAAILSYFLFFLQFPETRDVPWVTFLLFVPAVWLLAAGLKRAYRQPDRYRGKISGPILSLLSAGLIGLFGYFAIALTKDLPSGSAALQAGQRAPGFTLADSGGKPVALSEILGKNRGAVLIFYRGYW
jgi:hypothetical protein